ncbi:MAG: polysaccharide deacetylase family protein [Candidatus Sumerlaeota bacterium]|nr:polysaccharide deacetylase family protein [Candidatus Sumerlaeota bacterium]
MPLISCSNAANRLQIVLLCISISVLSSSQYAAAADDWGETNIARWKNDAQAAVSLTFDDNGLTRRDAIKVLDRFGLKATFFVITDDLNEVTKPMFRMISDGGHEVASHTSHHYFLAKIPAATLEKELVDSKRYLEKFTSQPCVCLAYPYGSVNAAVRAATMKHYLSARGTGSGDNPPEAINLACLRRNHTPAKRVADEDFIALLDEYVRREVSIGGWAIEMFHNVMPYNDELHVSSTTLAAHCEHLTSDSLGQLWIAPQGVVTRYYLEAQATSITVLSYGRHVRSIQLKSSLDPVLFNCPLTLITRIPAEWARANIAIEQAGQALPRAIHLYDEYALALYDALPAAGPVRIIIKP